MAGLRALLADTTPLQTPTFRRLWVANIITVIGAQLTVVAVPAQLYAITNSSAYVGLAGLFGLVPLIVFGLWGGALADHFDRRMLLIVTTAGLILTSGCFWAQAAAGLNNVWLLLGVFSLQQACFAVNQPTRTAVLPRLLPDEQLPAANALNMTVMTAGAIAGPLVGGALIPVVGFSWLYLIDTITLFATLSAVIRLPRLPVQGRTGSPGLRSIIEGVRFLRWHVVVLVSLGVDLVAMIFGMPRALFPELAHVSFGERAEGGLVYALLFVGIPLGSLVGGIFSGWYSRVRRQGLAVIVCILIWGGAIALFGVAVGLAPVWRTPMLVVAIVMLAVGGAADMASAAFRQTMLLAATDDAVRGRVQGVFIVVVAGGPRLADVFHGLAAEWLGAPLTAAIGGVLVVVTMLLIGARVTPFRNYTVTLPEPARTD
ncbi:MAG: MFS transporter [Propionicimonas sp.]|uniref:MFS transporter n=1 Tax=Propionicimonas sp. TaxID=1955623 RepID=UPI002B207FD6|nr:MFS transporter [Propionicimonas sp.]MEA4945738.1 MFS transporter [Propionicimonas sp.]